MSQWFPFIQLSIFPNSYKLTNSSPHWTNGNLLGHFQLRRTAVQWNSGFTLNKCVQGVEWRNSAIFHRQYLFRAESEYYVTCIRNDNIITPFGNNVKAYADTGVRYVQRHCNTRPNAFWTRTEVRDRSTGRVSSALSHARSKWRRRVRQCGSRVSGTIIADRLAGDRGGQARVTAKRRDALAKSESSGGRGLCLLVQPAPSESGARRSVGLSPKTISAYSCLCVRARCSRRYVELWKITHCFAALLPAPPPSPHTVFHCKHGIILAVTQRPEIRTLGRGVRGLAGCSCRFYFFSPHFS